MINCIIVDDEPLAREGISNYVKEVDFLHLIATCVNAVDLGKQLSKEKIDLIFLDIQMPIMNGTDFLRITRNPPMVILTTAYPHYALEGFHLNVMDYLLKPITFDRFFQAATKARDYHRLTTQADPTANPAASSDTAPPATQDYFFIKCSNKYEKIHFADILYIEGQQNYVTIYTTRGKFMTLLYLKKLEENLNRKSFIRVHKSYIVSINKIDSIDGSELVIATHRIPLSRNYREQVISQVVQSNLWIK